MKKTSLCIYLTLILSFCCVFPSLAADPVPVENIQLDPATAVVSIGKTVNIKTVIEPKNASVRKVDWSTSDETIATVRNGNVKGIAVGSAIITASATDESGVTASMEIMVVQPVKQIASDDAKLILAPGTTWIPDISIEPADATLKKLSWTSSDDKVAHVDENGEISAVATGKCNIIGSATDDSRQKISISLQVKEHDVIIPSKDEVRVSFETRGSWQGSRIQIGSWVQEESEEVIVSFGDGHVCEGSAAYKLRPLKSGSGTVEVERKHNGKRSDKTTYTVFVAQAAVPVESDAEIGRMASESYEGHTYQVFYSNRSWDAAEKFCEKHGGHLVTVTGDKEQKFLERMLGKAEKQGSYWIGLNSGDHRNFSKWVTGEAISYTKWADGNPDGNEVSGNCGRMAASEYTDENNWTMKRGTWDDVGGTYYFINGFICEWEEENSPGALPVLEASNEELVPGDKPVPSASTITILSGDESPYGKELILNAGTDSENVFIGYFLPAGTYIVTNQDTDKAIRVIPYEHTRQIIDGKEEFKTSKDKKPVMLFPGKSNEITLEENEFILFSDEQFSVLFERQ